MKQRLISIENIATVSRTFVYSADTLEDLYCFMEMEFMWFNREKYEIKVSSSRMGSISRKFIEEDGIPSQFEDLYIKIVPRKVSSLRCVENSQNNCHMGLLECGKIVHG